MRSRESQLEELERHIASWEALLAQDLRDRKRIADLYSRKLIAREQLEKIDLKTTADQNTLDALKQKRKQLQEAIAIARSDLEDARAAQKKIEALRDGIAALEAKEAQVAAVIDEMTLRSPLEGFTVEKIAHPGEVLGAGMPVATLIDPRSLYLKIFVDTLQNGRIKIGDKAEIFLDARPDRPIPARVVRIAQKAEFTPKEVSVRSDRIQQVFAVHLKPLRPDPLLKLGIPAVGVISVDGKGLPKSLDEIPPL
ncbi:HlyD family secretion protein [Nitratifractor sp.]